MPKPPKKDVKDPEGPGDDEDGGPGAPMMEQQDPQQRREIRRKYRELYQETQENQHDLIDPKSDGLHETLRKANEIFKDVKMTREGALDAQLLAAISHLGRQKAQALHTDLVVFEPVEFASKLITFMCGEQLAEDGSRKMPEDLWRKLGETVQPAFKRAPPLHLMLGTFVRGERQVKARIKKSIKPPDEPVSKSATIPAQVKSTKEKKEATTAEVERIHTTLMSYYNEWNRQPICFFEFVINPHSFGQTIENIFYASFLIRDGHARIFLDEDKLPVIEPVEHREGDAPQDNLKRHQVVMSINYQEWLDIIKTFKIQDPLIPTREVSEECNDKPPVFLPSGLGRSKDGPGRRSPTPGPSMNGHTAELDTDRTDSPVPPKRVNKRKK